ncbi:hypothetical protein B0T17DRAFT_512582 [Bombardia bombarda]|uniref:BTB domain-containing protein n=1 Tax=Bombardia bombarda TaxID=252184 RepID=A0AA39U2Q1_9PEZI|nr:hypothetical protein B0T17DRAFT_512582 [Bombardia bombarda]
MSYTGSGEQQDESRNELMQSLHQLFEKGSYSDLIVKCGDDVYKVHKAILCSRSVYFQKACDNMAFQEAQTGVIDFEVEEPVHPVAVKLTMHYLYHLDYPHQPMPQDGDAVTGVTEPETVANTTSHDGDAVHLTRIRCNAEVGRSCNKKKCQKHKRGRGLPPSSNLTTHARVFAIAEYLVIPGLKVLAVKKFREEVQKSWNSDDFFEAMEVVYTSTGEDVREMRDAIVDAIHSHQELLDSVRVKHSLRNNPPLTFDVLMRLRQTAILKETGLYDEWR